jgi:hypothetical protein
MDRQYRSAAVGTVYPDREPSIWEPTRRGRRVTYQEHGARASGRRQRRERVIDLEVTGGREQNAGTGRTKLGRYGDCRCWEITNQGSDDRKCGCRRPSGVIPPSQNQPFSIDRDFSTRLHRGNEIVDHPDLASGCTPRIILKLTVGDVAVGGEIVSSGSVTQGTGAVGVPGQPVKVEMGWTPIPP